MAVKIEKLTGEFTPDPGLNPERAEIIEATLGPLIDRHLSWTPTEYSPTEDISDADYGFVPQRFTDSIINPDYRSGSDRSEKYIRVSSGASLRPGREPFHFRTIAGSVLGIDPEKLYFEEEVRKMDGHGDFPIDEYDPQTEGWYRHLIREGVEIEDVKSMKKRSEVAEHVSNLTENNLPTYAQDTIAAVRLLERDTGLRLPASSTWFEGIWPAEEDKHSIAQDEYATIRRLNTSREYALARSSQLMAPSAVETDSLVGTLVYVTIQEYATKLSHARNALLFGPVGQAMQIKEAKDETRHYDLYGGVVRGLYENPLTTEEVIYYTKKMDENFDMPGLAGLPNYANHARVIADANIYGYEQHKESFKMAMKRFGMLDKDDDGSYIDPEGVSDLAIEALQRLRKKYDKEHKHRFGKQQIGNFVLGLTLTEQQLRELHRSYEKLKDIGQKTSTSF